MSIIGKDFKIVIFGEGTTSSFPVVHTDTTVKNRVGLLFTDISNNGPKTIEEAKDYKIRKGDIIIHFKDEEDVQFLRDMLDAISKTIKEFN